MLEVFCTDEFRDFSLLYWMGETPKMVIDHLFADDWESGEIFWENTKSVEKDEVTKLGTDEMTELRADEL
jgi:hypothetical protein